MNNYQIIFFAKENNKQPVQDYIDILLFMNNAIEKKLKNYTKKYPNASFDYYLAKKLKDKEFAKGFEREKVKTKIAIEVYYQRQKAKISLAKLENITGISRNSIAKIEMGKYLPSVNMLDKIAIGLGKELELSFR